MRGGHRPVLSGADGGGHGAGRQGSSSGQRDRPQGAGDRKPLPEAAFAAAAGGPGSAADLRRIEDDHRHGTHRRSGGGHRRDRSLFRREAGGKRRPFEGNGKGCHTNGDGKCGRLCEM